MPQTSPLIKSYIHYLEVERGLSTNTLRGYAADLLSLQTWASQNQLILRGLSARDLDRYVGSLCRANRNASSIDRAITAIRGLYQFLVCESEIPINPANDLSALKKTRHLPHVLTDHQVRRLIDRPDQSTLDGLHDRAMIEILFAAGLRLSEAIRLRLPDVSIDRRILRCIGKGNKERQVPFSQSAAHSLKAYLSAQRSATNGPFSEFIFVNHDLPITRQFAWSLIKRYATETGIPEMTPHSLRHTFATSLLNKGVPTEVVRQLLGHVSIATTEIYLSVSIDHVTRAYDRYHPRAAAPPPTAQSNQLIQR